MVRNYLRACLMRSEVICGHFIQFGETAGTDGEETDHPCDPPSLLPAFKETTKWGGGTEVGMPCMGILSGRDSRLPIKKEPHRTDV